MACATVVIKTGGSGRCDVEAGDQVHQLLLRQQVQLDRLEARLEEEAGLREELRRRLEDMEQQQLGKADQRQ